MPTGLPTAPFTADLRPNSPGKVDVRALGAIPNDSSSAARAANDAAFVAAIRRTGHARRGGAIEVPFAAFYFTQNLVIDRQVIMEGVGGWDGYEYGNGSTQLIFPAGSDGLVITRGGTTPYGSGLGPGDTTVIRDLCVIAEGKTTAGKHGIRMEARALLENVLAYGFSGHGRYFYGDTDATPETNVNQWLNIGGASRANGLCGLHIVGPDANAGVCIGLDCTGNGTWNIEDASGLGNTFIGCHVMEGGSGAYKAVGALQTSVFIGCYSESGQPPSDIKAPNSIYGGTHGAGFVNYPGSPPVHPGRTPQSATVDLGGGVTLEVTLGARDGTLSAFVVQPSDQVGPLRVLWDSSNNQYHVKLGGLDTGRGAIINGEGAPGDYARWDFPYGHYNGSRRRYPGTSAPSAGERTWQWGDYIENTQYAELGSAGSKYVVRGWFCIGGGDPGTWREDRGLTGN